MTENKPVQTREQKQNQKKFTIKKMNGWKIAFLVLTAFIIGSGIFLGTRIFSNREPNYSKSAKVSDKQGQEVTTISMNKSQLNTLIDYYLTDFQKDSSVKYQFALENEAMLSGETKVLNFPVQFYLYFDPYVMENGNIQLRAKSMSIGTLGLPIEEVMKLVKRGYDFPDWIDVTPKDKSITLRLDQFQLPTGLFVKAKKINLIDDEIQVGLYLPERKE
ncbi:MULTISPECIES: YpmS family protein [Enterococcus]|jgi:uncharacterized protein YpmS|uniref:YfaA n=1 Tax=Enterococcus dispar ATCC 51266 TaxID=1139219 RepID=S0KRQ0_9ENTE|nr:YpmS family protein [Enterococcus dispar]EOT42818.1 hypothetical protein OMK_01179 [Enterococcus dispar ATCC 51266]EOW84731.1 hypothetical protein I569_00020 [Enterococcus dispar ATCC 51266]MCU7356322.1 YpmS family protein [Enterococcus dispar]MDT2704639.1 YpmS family protein [Enterococcus dispar]OJG38140.1 hypothetical protein RV01_GL000500 [Enterococcus dispar]